MKTKTFDSVKLMRDLREKLSTEMAHLTRAERVRFIRERAALSGLGGSVEDGDASQRVDTAERPPAGS